MFTEEYELGPQVYEEELPTDRNDSFRSSGGCRGSGKPLPAAELAAASPLGMQCFVVSWLSMRASRSASRVALASR